MITSKVYCKCQECGSDCEVDTSMVLPSNPPQYQAFCKKCNKVIYTFCSDLYGITSINQENNFIEKDAEYHKDIHRIADALEKIAKSLEITDSNTNPILSTCPYCGSNNIQYMYGTAAMLTNKNQLSCHYICKDCHKEFDV